MQGLQQLKLVLEVVLLAVFLCLLVRVARTGGHERMLSLLTNMP